MNEKYVIVVCLEQFYSSFVIWPLGELHVSKMMSSGFREALPQVLAVSVKNVVLIGKLKLI